MCSLLLPLPPDTCTDLYLYPSDARSGSIIDDRIRPALEAGKAVKGSGRPVLVVIDEIDGATGAGDNVRVSSSLSFLH